MNLRVGDVFRYFLIDLALRWLLKIGKGVTSEGVQKNLIVTGCKSYSSQPYFKFLWGMAKT